MAWMAGALSDRIIISIPCLSISRRRISCTSSKRGCKVSRRARRKPWRSALDQHGAHAKAPGVDQRDAAVRAHEHHRAPAEAPVAHRFAGETLDDDVEIVFADSHAHSDARGCVETGSGSRR